MTSKFNVIALSFWDNIKAIALLILLGAGLILGVFIYAKYMGLNKYKPEIPVGSKIDYVIHTEYKDRPIYITKIKAKIDTVYEVQFLGDSGDSAYVPIQVAKADTLLLTDSSRIGITYYYPPRNYFDVKANIKEKIITKELTIEKPYDLSFWDRFNIVVYGGLSYDLIERRPSLSVGVGIGFNIKLLF